MKKLLVLMLITILALSTVLTGCSGNTAETNATNDAADATTDAATGEVIKLGVIGPLTGDYSMYGIAVEEGAKLAAEEINANGGINGSTVEIIAYDSKGDGVEGVNAYNKLINQDEIVALIGGTFSGVTLSIKELAIEDGTPVLSPTATHLDVTLDAPNVFRACYTDPYQGKAAATFALNDLGATKAAILYNIEDAYSEGLATAFNETFGANGTVTNFEGYATTDVDFKSVLTKIQTEEPDVLFLPDYVAKVGVVLAQIEELGLDVAVIGGDGWDSIEAEYADVAEGHYFVNHYAKTDEAPVIQEFIAAYEAKWDQTPNALAALSYDATYMMTQAIENAGSTDSDAIVAALAPIEIDGVTGHIMFDENGDTNKSISVIQVVGGEHVLVTKISAE